MKPTPPQIATTQAIKNGGSPTKTINNAPPKKQQQFKDSMECINKTLIINTKPNQF